MTQDATLNLTQKRQPLTDGPNLPVRDSSTYAVIPVNVASLNPTRESKTMPNLGRILDTFGMGSNQPDEPVTPESWETSYAQDTLTDYIQVRIPMRGAEHDGKPTTYTFRFLVNPQSIQVNYNTIDSQALTRTGWQFGVWGEDLIQISMSGKTAGSYFNKGLTDSNKRMSMSYRNLLDLQHIFENNGYWFEGEEAFLKAKTPEEKARVFSATRKLIKCHEDIQLVYGNFVWYGMFESMSVASTADTPFLDTFKLSFVAWKERYLSTSPYYNSLPNDVLRGHTMGAWGSYGVTGFVNNLMRTVDQTTNMDPKTASHASDPSKLAIIGKL